MLLFLDISGGEIVIILIVIFLIFGPQKLPGMARKAGQVMNDLKRASSDITREFKDETDFVRKEYNRAKDKIVKETMDINSSIKRDSDEINKNLNDTAEEISQDKKNDDQDAQGIGNMESLQKLQGNTQGVTKQQGNAEGDEQKGERFQAYGAEHCDDAPGSSLDDTESCRF